MGVHVSEHPPDTIRRCHLVVEGLVQGIGFRPSVYRLARDLGLHGTVYNDRCGVVIEAEGPPQVLERFVAILSAPGAGRVAVAWPPPRGERDGFSIGPTRAGGSAGVHPAPDLATCPACLSELRDPANRRHRYPLLTCTACGPRFTIARDVPWARPATTLAGFPLCPACRAEYVDPADRRFHAEATACADCGPRVVFRAAGAEPDAADDPVAAATGALARGAIVAVKGIGGYHLACDATNDAAVAELRQRKHREARPLALMLADLHAVREVCEVSDAEAALLVSPARPIVLLRRRQPGSPRIAPAVAPRLGELGVMLPYTPLHHLLLEGTGRPLVMTSANASGEPILHDDAMARAGLRGLADHVLAHDRPIHAPVDDSVARVVGGAPLLLRRARGHVPGALPLPVPAAVSILAVGGHLKSVFALARGADAFLSPHLGDLDDARAWHGYLEAVAHFERILGLEPRVVAHDLHPGYRTTAWASTLDGAERIGVQHHHAHVASCLADNGLDARVLGVAWDGTGYGPDGTVWGGEFLLADLGGFTRVGHLEAVPMPGGEAAVRAPWRMAGALLMAAYGERAAGLDIGAVARLDRAGWRVVREAVRHGINVPLTSSAGRLFDGVASLLGLRDVVSFEGQAAMELEAAAGAGDRVYPVTVEEAGDRLVVRTTDVVRGVVEDLLEGEAPGLIAARFHGTLAQVIARVAVVTRERHGVARVALSGGVFQNARLLEGAISVLEGEGFEVLRHRHVPPNDGGLALGQAAVAARRMTGGTG